MTYDTGFAPCVVSGQELTLACCKTLLRYKVTNEMDSPGSNIYDFYVMGLSGKGLTNKHRHLTEDYQYSPIYIAKIHSSIEVEDYYSEKGFKNRPDQKYLYKDDKWYTRENNPHYKNVDLVFKGGLAEIERDMQKDLVYRPRKNSKIKQNFVLLSNEYIYLGKEIMSLDRLPKVINKIADIRGKAYRGGLNPIELSNGEKSDFSKFFNEYKGKKVNPKAISLDPYFLKDVCEGACK